MNETDIPIAISALITTAAKNMSTEEILLLMSALNYSIDTLSAIIEMRKILKISK